MNCSGLKRLRIMGRKHKKIPSKRTLAKDCKKQFEQFVEDFNAEVAEQQTEEESDAEEFAEKYLIAMRRKLGIEA